MKRTIDLTLTAVTIGAATTASAEEDPIDQTADLIAEAAPDQGAVAPVDLDGDVATATVGDTDVTVPTDPSATITLDNTATSAPALEVSLPAEVNVGSGQVADDGTIIYPATDNMADAAVQVLDDGSVRLETVTQSAAGPHEFTYSFGDDVTPIKNPDGTIELFQDQGDFAMTVGGVGVTLLAKAIPSPIAQVVAGIASIGSAYIGFIYASNACVKAVSYMHVGAAWQPYGGSEAGGYCR